MVDITLGETITQRPAPRVPLRATSSFTMEVRIVQGGFSYVSELFVALLIGSIALRCWFRVPPKVSTTTWCALLYQKCYLDGCGVVLSRDVADEHVSHTCYHPILLGVKSLLYSICIEL